MSQILSEWRHKAEKLGPHWDHPMTSQRKLEICVTFERNKIDPKCYISFSSGFQDLSHGVVAFHNEKCWHSCFAYYYYYYWCTNNTWIFKPYQYLGTTRLNNLNLFNLNLEKVWYKITSWHEITAGHHLWGAIFSTFSSSIRSRCPANLRFCRLKNV